MEFELDEQGNPKLDENGQPIPKTSSPPAPEPTSPEKAPTPGNSIPAEALEVIQEQQRRIRELEQFRDEKNKPPAPSKDDLTKQYYEDPATFFDNIISAKIKEQTEPLNAFVSQQRKDAEIASYVQMAENSEDYADDLKNPAFKTAFVQALRGVPQLDQNIVMIVLNNVTALAYKGKLPGFKQAAPTNTNPVSPVTPPYLPPSSAGAPPKDNKTKVELTEQEKKLARMNRMTDEEYVALRDSDSRSFMKETK